MSSFIVMDIVKEAEKFSDAIHFEIGQPDLPPSPRVKEALHTSIDENRFSYTQSHGLIALRKKIAAHYKKRTTSRLRLSKSSSPQVLVERFSSLMHLPLEKMPH